MQPDSDRIERVRRRMHASGLDALLCRLSHHVLLLTGYAPVLGNSFVLFPLEGDPVLLVPACEEKMAHDGWVEDIRPYASTTLLQLGRVLEAVEPMLAQLAREKDLLGGTIGYEHDYGMVPASYPEIEVTSPATVQLIQEAFGNADWKPADRDLERLEAVLTEREVDMVRLANMIAAEGMMAAKAVLRPRIRECDVAGEVSRAVMAAGLRLEPVRRVMAFPHVLSGPRTEEAYKPFALTSGREILRGDQVLVQLEVYLDGFWAEITRTFILGRPSADQRAAYEACLAAMERARQMERPNDHASGVDISARSVLIERGYGSSFRHGLGHGVGFQAISHERLPRLHPASPDILLPGMVHNMEPGIYYEHFGLRINDDVLVTEGAPEQLTPLPSDLEWATCTRRRTISLPREVQPERRTA